MTRIEIENNTLVFHSPYDPGLVTILKSRIPSTDRRWDANRKVWLVAPAHAQTLVQLSQQFLNEMPEIQPSLFQTSTALEEKTFVVKYIGACKDRGGERTAFGWVNGDWYVVFPESVLRTWFDMSSSPDEAQTLYQVLGISKHASVNEIKTAYRRLAKQWHPDICKEPNAAEQFKLISNAHEILSDPTKRARYDAGLALEATLERKNKNLGQHGEWRPPLRCGVITMHGRLQLSRFIVEKIIKWRDIVENGKTLVVSWPAGSDHFVENWI